MIESYLIIAKNINMDRDYVNVLNTKNIDLLSICRDNNHLVAEQHNYSFLNYNSNQISVGIPYSMAIQGNYIAFQNKHYSNKWFFAWIDSVEFVSEKTTLINYTIDAWSTFYSDITVKTSFVIREHVNDDTIGINTIPENIELGEYINQPKLETDEFIFLRSCYIVFAMTETVIDASIPIGVRSYGGVFSGLINLIFENGSEANKFIRYCNSKSKQDAIYGIYLVPSLMFNEINFLTYSESPFSFEYAFMPYSNTTSNIENINIEKTNYIDDDYVPVNKKLLSFPYKCFTISNLAGEIKTYLYELFRNEDSQLNPTMCHFIVKGVPTAGCSIKLIPENYKGSSLYNYDESINASKLPQCSWTTDMFTSWLVENGVNLAVQTGIGLATTAIGAGVGIAGAKTVNLARAIGAQAGLSGASSIANTVQQIYSHSIEPDSAKGGSNQGDIVFTLKEGFFIQRKSIRKEYAKIIDDYFTRFGYKINRLKIPNTTGRRNWNYVEIGTSEDFGNGNVPHEFMEKINQAVRNGVTIWHNHANIGNFSLDNSIN